MQKYTIKPLKWFNADKYFDPAYLFRAESIGHLNYVIWPGKAKKYRVSKRSEQTPLCSDGFDSLAECKRWASSIHRADLREWLTRVEE